MKCRYSLPHQPQKCGLLKSSWNDPVAKMERSARVYEKECVYIGDNWWEIGDDELDRACMTEAEFRQYARPRTTMFGWHISDLVIYERTKSLREFHRPCDSKCDGLCFEGVNCCRTLTRPPQSWCYVAEEAHHD